MDMDSKNRRVTPMNDGSNNPMFGRKHSDETIKLLSLIRKGKYAKENHSRASITEATANEIKSLKYSATAKQVSEKLFVSVHVVRNIWRGKSW